MKTLSLRQPGDGSGPGIAVADTLDRFKVKLNQVDIKAGPKCLQAVSIEMNPAAEKLPFRTIDKCAGIDELLPFNSRHNTKQCVIK